MTIYKKPDLKVFGANAKPTEVAEFEDLLRGWGITIEKTNGIPPMEWFNYLFNRLDGNINYILQNGITEYDTNLEYPQNAVVKSGGKLYLCLRQNTNKPLSNGAYWELLIKNATTSQGGVVQLSNAVDSTDETRASTPKATKTAYDKAVQANDNANKAQQRADSAYNLASTKENKITRSDSVANNSSVTVATSKAVKSANDNANKRVLKTGDTMTGTLNIATNGTPYSALYLKNTVDNTAFVMTSISKRQDFCGYLIYKENNSTITTVAVPRKNGSLCMRNEGVPIGAFFPYTSGETLPDGYLWMDNGFYDPETYPDLFKVIGYYYGRRGNKFMVPSIENRFIRGMGNGLTLGQKQEDAIRNITAEWQANISSSTSEPVSYAHDSLFSGALFASKGTHRGKFGGDIGNEGLKAIAFDASRVVPTAEENRPKSIAFPYIIKY